jgi:hypothetical protein
MAGPTDTGSPPGRPDANPADGTTAPADGAAGAAGTETTAEPAAGHTAAGGVQLAFDRDGGTARGVTVPVGTATPPGPGDPGFGAAAASSGQEKTPATMTDAIRIESDHRNRERIGTR